MQITRAKTEDIPALCLLLETLFTQEAELTPDKEQQRGLHAINIGRTV